jgi:protein-disulfide isomerase
MGRNEMHDDPSASAMPRSPTVKSQTLPAGARPARTVLHGLAVLALGLGLMAGRAAAQGLDLKGLGFDKGSPAAPIAVVEFGDFGCSACALFFRDTWPALNREFIATGRIKYKYVPFVLGSFPNSGAATKAALCAAEQDAFWSMHDVLYTRQKEWKNLIRPAAQMEKYAVQLNLNRAKYRECYDRDRAGPQLQQANDIAQGLLVRATPTFFINGQRGVGALSIDQWRQIVTLMASGR